MSPQERHAWSQLVLIAGALAVYTTLLLLRADGGPLAETPYAGLMIGVVTAFLVLGLGAHLLFRAATRGEEPDERDREIEGRATQIGASLLVIGALVALGLAMAEQPQFWIAQTLFLTFAAQGILASVARIGLYRVGVPGW